MHQNFLLAAPDDKIMIRAAIDQWVEKTCVRFSELTPDVPRDTYYIRFQAGSGFVSADSSSIAMVSLLGSNLLFFLQMLVICWKEHKDYNWSNS